MNEFEKLMFDNYVLFYADYLSLKNTCKPITDICKYYYLMDCPINAAYIVDLEPVYDTSNQYYVQSYTELKVIYDKIGYKGLSEFVQDLCFLKPLGVISGENILKCITMYDNSKARKKALDTYRKYMKSISYDQCVTDNNGDPLIQKCTKYVYHVDKNKSKKQ